MLSGEDDGQNSRWLSTWHKSETAGKQSPAEVKDSTRSGHNQRELSGETRSNQMSIVVVRQGKTAFSDMSTYWVMITRGGGSRVIITLQVATESLEYAINCWRASVLMTIWMLLMKNYSAYLWDRSDLIMTRLSPVSWLVIMRIKWAIQLLKSLIRSLSAGLSPLGLNYIVWAWGRYFYLTLSMFWMNSDSEWMEDLINIIKTFAVFSEW